MVKAACVMGMAAGACLGVATAMMLLMAGPERILYAIILGGAALQFLVWTLLRTVVSGPDRPAEHPVSIGRGGRARASRQAI